ncbi:MAG: RNA polymerase sigma factor, partial [Terriglobia bacterium]
VKMIDTYEGDPYPYLVRVANNLVSEHKGKAAKVTSLPDDFHLEIQSSDEELEHTFECLDRCMEKLQPTKRQVVLEYYQENKKAKIERRKKIAASLDIPLNALRIRMCRTRDSLHQCVLQCLEGNDSMEIAAEMD